MKEYIQGNYPKTGKSEASVLPHQLKMEGTCLSRSIGTFCRDLLAGERVQN